MPVIQSCAPTGLHGRRSERKRTIKVGLNSGMGDYRPNDSVGGKTGGTEVVVTGDQTKVQSSVSLEKF